MMLVCDMIDIFVDTQVDQERRLLLKSKN